MRLLLDSHVLMRWETKSPQIGAATREILANRENQVFVSAATIWELAIKRRSGMIAFEGPLVQAVERAGFTELPVTGADAEAAGALDWDHPDPFDRLLVAQAGRHSLTLVTADRAILAVAGIALLRLR